MPTLRGMKIDNATKIGKKKRQCQSTKHPNKYLKHDVDVNYLVNKIVDLELQLETVKTGRSMFHGMSLVQSLILMIISMIGFGITIELGHFLLFNGNALTEQSLFLRGFSTHNNVPHSPSPSELEQEAQTYVLLSTFRPVTADVMGALGPPQVVTEESTSSWLSDRWQVPLSEFHEELGVQPEPHWIELDLQRSCLVRKVVIDWENAYSDSWYVEGRLTGSSDWRRLGDSRGSKEIERRPFHIIQEAYTVTGGHLSSSGGGGGGGEGSPSHAVRYVRLMVNKAATKWGISIWRVQLWGNELK
eukprot:CAMPEP_0182418404 /NCGR_PEP_ID=MMETSP1167-20130531/2849_1 /TAXON_ID=2988 /ORGANISM="Mallomonas Sp, Strain CCMP3275" /LENGTH=301 /DNA_ID=CAMNT_0024592601 /DNA_START=293 /DNA_END=1198 /DNA_ORIENTATION=-